MYMLNGFLKGGIFYLVLTRKLCFMSKTVHCFLNVYFLEKTLQINPGFLVGVGINPGSLTICTEKTEFSVKNSNGSAHFARKF